MTKQPMHVTEGNFGGKIANFTDTLNDKGEVIKTWKEERTQEQKHLKAYLAGHEYFRNGYKVITNKIGDKEYSQKVPNWLPVTRLEVENSK